MLLISPCIDMDSEARWVVKNNNIPFRATELVNCWIRIESQVVWLQSPDMIIVPLNSRTDSIFRGTLWNWAPSEFTEGIVSRMHCSIWTCENVRQRLMVYIGKKTGPGQILYSHLLGWAEIITEQWIHWRGGLWVLWKSQ